MAKKEKAKSKDLSRRERIIKQPITNFIDTKYRDYAVYVLEARGIPNWQDGITPVSRYVLMNAPSSFQKTLTLVGSVISSGYHHGDAGLSKNISRLARPFGNSLQLLEGYGFFGTEVCQEAAAARYTSVKLSKAASDVIKKYDYLNTREKDGPYDPLWMEFPIGLTNTICGIAVGYNSFVLPRNPIHIREFLEGKRKTVKPYITDFLGTITKFKELDKSWLLSANIAEEGKKFKISSVPPIIKYATILKKMNNISTKFPNIRYLDNSNKKVDIEITYLGNNQQECDALKELIFKSFSILVNENPVFIKDGQVIVYESIEQYLEDYKYQVERLKLNSAQHLCDKTNNELEYEKAKKEFIKFMITKKRINDEIDEYFKKLNSDNKQIIEEIQTSNIEKLERLTSRKFTLDEIKTCEKNIIDLTMDLKVRKADVSKLKKEFEKLIDPTIKRGITSKKSNSLFEGEVDEFNGIEVWGGDEIIEVEGTESEDED